MHTFPLLPTLFGLACFFIGVTAALFGGGGPVEHVVALGNSLIIAGAILTAGALISTAVAARGKW